METFCGTDPDFTICCCGNPGKKIRFIVDHKIRNLFFLKPLDQCPILRREAKTCINDQNGDVCFIQDLIAFADAQSAQFAFVIDTGRVDDDYRSEGKQFHSLFYRVGGGS